MWRFTGMVHVWCVEIPCNECWCMNVGEWMMSVDAWMLMNEWMIVDEWMMNVDGWMNDECWWMNDERIWVLMHVDECEMYVEWWLMHWCVMHWCMLNRLMCVKCMYIFCNHNCILYWFCNCFNVLILIFVFVCLSGFLYLVSCTCNKTVTPYDGVCLRPHAHEPVTSVSYQYNCAWRCLFYRIHWGLGIVSLTAFVVTGGTVGCRNGN